MDIETTTDTLLYARMAAHYRRAIQSGVLPPGQRSLCQQLTSTQSPPEPHPLSLLQGGQESGQCCFFGAAQHSLTHILKKDVKR